MSDLKEALNKKLEEASQEHVVSIERKKGSVVYTGDYGLTDKLAVRIPRIGNEYFPTNEGQVAELEYQVSQGRVVKETF